MSFANKEQSLFQEITLHSASLNDRFSGDRYPRKMRRRWFLGPPLINIAADIISEITAAQDHLYFIRSSVCPSEVFASSLRMNCFADRRFFGGWNFDRFARLRLNRPFRRFFFVVTDEPNQE